MKLQGEEREHMEALVADLESGEHEKGKGKLHIIVENGPDRWCCLGRAGAVAVAGGCQVERYITRTFDEGTGKNITVEGFGSSTEILCEELQEWYGVYDPNPVLLMGDGNEISASSINDNGYDKEYTLPEIGALFRRTYLEDSAGESSSGDTTSA